MVERVTLGLMALLFLVSFTQTTNFNSGGTPDPSRYGLWLVPFAIPILSSVPASARWLKVLAAGSVAWCVWAFAPGAAGSISPADDVRRRSLEAMAGARQSDRRSLRGAHGRTRARTTSNRDAGL